MEAKDLDKVSDLLFKRKYTELIVTEQLRLDQAIDYIKRAGIKEVVEWINSRHPNDIVTRAFWEEDWQTQVKEWGIE